MNTYKITWEKKDKYLPFKRVTKVKAASELDARSALHREMGNERRITIISVEEEKASSEEECDGQGCIAVS